MVDWLCYSEPVVAQDIWRECMIEEAAHLTIEGKQRERRKG